MKSENFIVNEKKLLIDFLKENIKNKSKNNIKSILKRGSVYVDGKLITKHDYVLKPNQTVNIKLNVSIDSIDIIYEDKDLIVINKPSGLLSISTEKEKSKTAYYIVSNYLKSKNKNAKIFVIHRLDKDTSGVLMFAKNEKIKHLFQDNWEKIVIKRGYIAVVEGVLKKEGTIKSYLDENKNLVVYSTKNKKDGKLAITRYNVTRTNDNYSLLNVEIDTGRKNQIRVHMHDIGHPIVGDEKYGSKLNPINRLGLHANELILKNPITNKIMTFEAEIPSEFNNLFR